MAKATQQGTNLRNLNSETLWVFAEKHPQYGLQMKAYDRKKKAFCIVGKLSSTGRVLSVWEERTPDPEEMAPLVMTRLEFEQHVEEAAMDGFNHRGESFPTSIKTCWEKYDAMQQERYNAWEDKYETIIHFEAQRSALRNEALNLWNANPMSTFEQMLFWWKARVS